MNDAPMKSWKAVRLGEVLSRTGETIEADPSLEYSEIKVRLWGKGVLERARVSGAEVNGRRFVAKAGNFIASRIDARNGAMGLVPESLDGALVTNDFPLFQANKDRLDLGYLGWLSKTAGFVELCLRASEGTTNRVRLKEDRFLALEIPLPPLSEQRRIVARIEALAAGIAEAKRLRQEAVAEAEALVTAETTRIVESLEKVPRCPIRECGAEGENPIQIGPFGAQLHRSEFVEFGVPVLNVGNVWPTGLRLDSLDHVTEAKADQLSRYRIKEGDLLFARSGATLGKVCLVPSSCDEWLMTGHLFRVRFDRSRVFNRYAFALLRSSRQVLDEMFGQVRGATRPGFNTTLLGGVNLPLPPVPEQRRIVAELDALQEQVDSLKSLQSETSAELDALLPAILDRAFKGEL